KSSLINLITKSNVLVENKLFATLDTTTRELFIDGKKKALISDTVGFISQLPHELIEAFKSTLDELNYSNLLLHVIDISNKDSSKYTKPIKGRTKNFICF
ncbi:GTPase, partial [Candidatus Dependentiae bacterium]